MIQVGLDRGDLTRLWDPVLRLFPKDELSKVLQHATLTREQRGRFLILELIVHKMR